VVGTEGVDKSTWKFDIKRAVPHVLDEMMVAGRNAKSLAELLDTEEARQGDEGERLADSPAEVVALRLYSGMHGVGCFTFLALVLCIGTFGFFALYALVSKLCTGH